MKKTLLILGIIALVFAGCKKFDEIEASKLEITNETIERDFDYIKINVEYDYPVELEAVTLYLSEKEDLSGAKTYSCKIEGKTFSVEIKDLKEGTKYYYQFEYDNGYEKEKSEKESVVIYAMPVVVTKDVTNKTTTSVTLNGSVTSSDTENKITAKGFCWGTEPGLTIEGTHTNDGSGTGTYSYNLSNLNENTTYYVRAYATTKLGTAYGEEKSFKTVEVTSPTVTTNNVTNITANSAICGGNVTDDGNGTVTARGICWSEVQNPTINNIYSEETNNGTGTGSFTSQLTNLKENTTYYVRAYATNEKGTSYGEEKSFKTESLINGYDWVDLGLPSGLKWATCNVGANNPEDYGNYYAWGETEPAPGNNYSESNCEAYGLSISELQSQGIIDGDHNLTPSHDAATANWGGIWRMPTEAEQQELLNNCTWEWTVQGGKNGCKVTGPNGNNIFLPAAGYRIGSSLYYAGEYGCYRSSTPYESNSSYAFSLFFTSSSQRVDWYYRSNGQSVRPVAE